jgi:hypothetical protein
MERQVPSFRQVSLYRSRVLSRCQICHWSGSDPDRKTPSIIYSCRVSKIKFACCLGGDRALDEGDDAAAWCLCILSGLICEIQIDIRVDRLVKKPIVHHYPVA